MEETLPSSRYPSVCYSFRAVHIIVSTSCSQSRMGSKIQLSHCPVSLTENVGLSERQKGRGLFSGSGWSDAVMQVTLHVLLHWGRPTNTRHPCRVTLQQTVRRRVKSLKSANVYCRSHLKGTRTWWNHPDMWDWHISRFMPTSMQMGVQKYAQHLVQKKIIVINK